MLSCIELAGIDAFMYRVLLGTQGYCVKLAGTDVFMYRVLLGTARY